VRWPRDRLPVTVRGALVPSSAVVLPARGSGPDLPAGAGAPSPGLGEMPG